MMRKFFIIAALLIMCCSVKVSGQQVSVGTNAADWANHGTANLSLNVSMGAHLTVGVSGRYNPWFFRSGTADQVNHAVRGASLDFRYWPWHIYSGWWIMLKGQALEFNYGNLYGSRFSEQGKALGGGIGAGYALMLGKHWNVDFGLSVWAGSKDFRRYDCSFCGKPVAMGRKGFILPDNVFVSFCYIF